MKQGAKKQGGTSTNLATNLAAELEAFAAKLRAGHSDHFRVVQIRTVFPLLALPDALLQHVLTFIDEPHVHLSARQIFVGDLVRFGRCSKACLRHCHDAMHFRVSRLAKIAGSTTANDDGVAEAVSWVTGLFRQATSVLSVLPASLTPTHRYLYEGGRDELGFKSGSGIQLMTARNSDSVGVIFKGEFRSGLPHGHGVRHYWSPSQRGWYRHEGAFTSGSRTGPAVVCALGVLRTNALYTADRDRMLRGAMAAVPRPHSNQRSPTRNAARAECHTA